MSGKIELIQFEHSEKVKFGSAPYLKINSRGASVMNKKVVSLLEIQDGDVVSFFQDANDLSAWYFGKTTGKGAGVFRNGGMLKFCETALVKKMFESMGITGKSAYLPTAAELTEVAAGVHVLYVIPNPFNITE